MRLLYRRPLATVCFLSVALLGAAVFLPFSVKAILCGGGLILAAVLFMLPRFSRKSGAKPTAEISRKEKPDGMRALAAASALTLSVCMLCSALWEDLPQYRYGDLTEGEHSVTARVISVSGTGDYVTTEMRLTEADGKAADLRVCLFFYNGFAYEEGDVLRFSATADRLSRQNSDDIYLLADGCRYELTPVTAPEKTGHRFSLAGSMRRLRGRLSDEVGKVVPERPAELVRALLLGDRSGLPLSDTVAFRRLGIGHLLALSGLHLSVLLGFVLAFFRRLCPYRAVTAPVACLLVAAYAMLTGGSVSILRAALMSGTALLSWLWGARRDPLTALAVAGAVLMFFSPGCAYDCAFWLSFSATLAILVLSPWLTRRKTNGIRRLLTEKILFPVLLTACASLFTLLPTALFFGRISTVSIPANLLIAPMVEICLILSLFLPLLGAIPAFGSFVGFVVGKWASLTLDAAEWMAQIPNATAFLNHPLILTFIFCLTVVVCLILFGPKRLMAVFCGAALVLLIAVTAAAARINTDAMTAGYVRYCAAKSTDALLLSHSGDKTLVLCGKGSSASARAQTEMLTEERVAELDAVVLAHCHASTAQAWLRRLLSDVKIGTVYLPAGTDGTVAGQLRDMLSPFGTELRFLSAAETCSLSKDTDILVFPESTDENGREAFGYTLTVGGNRWTLFSQAMAGSPSLPASVNAGMLDGNVIAALHGYSASLPVTPLYTRKTVRLIAGRGDMSLSFLPGYPPPPVTVGDDLRFDE